MASLNCHRATCLSSRTIARPQTNMIKPIPPRLISTTQPLRTQQQRQQQQRHTYRPSSCIAARPSTQRLTSQSQRRHASSSSHTSPSSSTTTASPPADILTWNRFFELRRKRRFLNLGCSVVTAALAVPLVAGQDIDAWAAQISGLDPFMMLLITTATVGTGGWLCGPSVGSALFRLWARRKGWTTELAEKEKSLYARVKRYRANPASSSVQNPVPDYYGEKISSVKDYRRWLKDQRAFNLKKDKAIF